MNDVAAVATEADTAALVNTFRDRIGAIRTQVRRVIVGQEEVVDSLLLTLLVGGYAQKWHLGARARPTLTETVAQLFTIAATSDLYPVATSDNCASLLAISLGVAAVPWLLSEWMLLR